MRDENLEGAGVLVLLLVLWLLVGVLPGYLIGIGEAFPGNNEAWFCTRWENKPNGDCTQYTRKEAKP